MMMFSQAESIVQMAYKRAALASNERRKANASRKLDFYQNEQESHILALIQQQYSKNAEKVMPVNLNVVRKIVDLKSAVYMQDATRLVNGTEQDQQIYAAFEDSAALPATMKICNRLTTLCGTTILRPVFRRGRMEVDVLTPDMVDVVCGDSPSDLQAVTVENWQLDGKVESRTFSVWTAETLTRLDYRGRVISEEANPYKILPFVVVHSALPVNDFWLDGASNDLMSAQDAINLHLSGLLRTIHFQGFGVGWIRGAGDVSTSDLTLGPGSLVTLPEGGAIGFEAPKAPVADTLAAIEFILQQTAIANGLPASVLQTSAREMSGAALLVENAELAEARRDQLAMFAKVEQELFHLFKLIWNVHNTQQPMSAGATLKTDFYDPQPSISAYDRFALFEKQYRMGLASATDWLISQNPDLSRGDAVDELLRVAEENQRMSGLSPASMNINSLTIPPFPTA